MTGSVTGGVSGNAGTATKLATARLINVSGDVTGTAQSFDGSANITIPTAITAGSIVNDDINAAANISDTKLATISTANKVSNSATTATSANTAFAIVARDANGNFSANQITANLTGTVTGNATNVSGTVAILNGGTGATTAAGALTSLGAAAATHTHTNATATVGGVAGVAGFMSAADKTKLDGVANNATAYAHPTGDGNLHVPATSTTNNGKVLKAGSTAGSLSWGTLTAADVGAAASSHTHPYSQITDSPYKDGVTVATTAALTANYSNGASGVGGTLTNISTLSTLVIDGVTATTGIRFLVKNQVVTSQNGIYSVTNIGSTTAAWVLTRATDSDTNAELGGAIVSVDRGTSGGKLFSTSFRTTDTVGTSACLWQQIYDQGDGTLLAPWVTKSGAYTAVAGDRISANTSAGAFIITLPAAPANYTEIIIADHYDQWATRNLTIARNNQNIEGLAENLVCNVAGSQITLRYEGTTWRVY